MAISFQTLVEYVREVGLEHHDASEENKRILARLSTSTNDPVHSKMEKAVVVVILQEDGEFLQMRIGMVVEMDEVKDSRYLGALTTYFCTKNFENKIGRWCLDVRDGEVYVDWAIPVEDNDKLTFKQFERMYYGLVSSAKEAYGPIRHILATGLEKPVNAEELKKDIVFKLLAAQKFDLMTKAAAVTDLTKLLEIKRLADAGEFNGIEKMIG
jgi:hypothetical protein